MGAEHGLHLRPGGESIDDGSTTDVGDLERAVANVFSYDAENRMDLRRRHGLQGLGIVVAERRKRRGIPIARGENEPGAATGSCAGERLQHSTGWAIQEEATS